MQSYAKRRRRIKRATEPIAGTRTWPVGGPADNMAPAHRRRTMASVKGRDTAPELLVRRIAHQLGFRFRLHRRDLPGSPADRFGVILDAKLRRDGYTLGTDDRQFCEYATRHSRELAQPGIDRVYFAVIGSGFRQHDLDNLARFMAAEPIRSVCFLEAHALMRLVNDSIRMRDTFRLAEIDRLLFGNKIIDR